MTNNMRARPIDFNLGVRLTEYGREWEQKFGSFSVYAREQEARHEEAMAIKRKGEEIIRAGIKSYHINERTGLKFHQGNINEVPVWVILKMCRWSLMTDDDFWIKNRERAETFDDLVSLAAEVSKQRVYPKKAKWR
jgi:hypothetical protein